MIYSQPSRTIRHRTRNALRLTLLLSTLLVSGQALAQDGGADVLTPMDLFDGGEVDGVRVGPGLILRPKAEVQMMYDSNVYNIETGELDDFVAILKPELLFQTEMTRHYAEVKLGAELRRYADITSENSEQFELSGRSKLDLGTRVGLETEGGIARRIEQRGTAGDQFFTDNPVVYTTSWAGVELSRTGGTLELFGGAEIEKLDYSNASSLGVPINLGIRDVQILKARARVQYALGPATKFFVEGEVNEVEYDLNTAPSRDSSGYSVLGGIHYQLTALIEVEAAFGYNNQNFDNPLAESVSGIDYALSASWTPTPRWEVTANGERSIEASPIGNAPALVRSQFDLKVLTVMSNRILLESQVGIMEEDYRTIARTDERYFANVGVLFRINDNLGAKAQFGYRKQSSDFLNESYDGFSVGFGITAQI